MDKRAALRSPGPDPRGAGGRGGEGKGGAGGQWRGVGHHRGGGGSGFRSPDGPPQARPPRAGGSFRGPQRRAARKPIMRRAAVYARKSSDSEAGVERQVEIARDFIATQEWLPGPVFTDNAISGATYDRPGLNALLAAMVTKPRPFDVLVMMNVDRLSRGTIAETLELQQRILKTGVEVAFCPTGQRVTLTTATDELKGAIDAFGARH